MAILVGRALLVTAICAALFLWAAVGPVFAEWEIEQVDGRRRQAAVSLRLSPAGNLAIAYGEGVVYYAEYQGGVWRREIADDTPCAATYASLTFDETGEPLVAYESGPEMALQVARRTGASWTVEDLGVHTCWAGPILAGSGSDGALFVMYGDYDEQAWKVARWDGSVWTADTINSRAIGTRGAAFAVDPDGNPAVAYPWYDGLHLARFAGGRWTNETVPEAGDAPSLAFDSAGNPVISSVDLSRPALTVTLFDGISWNTDTVDTAVSAVLGCVNSLILDPAGDPVIAYADFDTNDLKLASWNGSAWTPEAGVMERVGMDNRAPGVRWRRVVRVSRFYGNPGRRVRRLDRPADSCGSPKQEDGAEEQPILGK